MTPLTDIPLSEILPQRPPFVFIDALTGFDERTTQTRYTVPSDGMLTEESHLSAYGLIENAAQTCAARLGYANYIRHAGIDIGFIGALRDFSIARLPREGETLTTRIDVIEDIFGLTLVDVTTSIGPETIATGQMKIAIRPSHHEA